MLKIAKAHAYSKIAAAKKDVAKEVKKQLPKPVKLTKREKLMAIFADEVYRSPSQRRKQIEKYDYVARLSTPYHAVYIYSSKKEIILSIRGTKPTDPRDLLSDVNIIRGSEVRDERFLDEEEFLIDLREAMPEYSVVLVGHSLGGSIVNFLVGSYGGEKGISGFAFNAGGRVSKKIIAKYLLQKDNKVELLNLRILGDPVSNFALHTLGKTKLFLPLLKSNPHSMDNFLN